MQRWLSVQLLAVVLFAAHYADAAWGQVVPNPNATGLASGTVSAVTCTGTGAATCSVTNGTTTPAITVGVTGGGTVTSVGVSGANGIGVSGSPVTTSGTIALSLGAITPTSVTTSTINGTPTITAPTLVAPALGAATATSINKLAITTPASSATLTVANGKTATVNNTLTLAGTDGTTLTFPTTSATVARTDAGNTFTGNQTVNEAAGGSGLTVTGATQTTSQPVINASQTWNASGVAFTGIKLNVTSTASAAGSNLLDLRVGGTSELVVDKNGVVTANNGFKYTAASGVTAGAYLTAGSANHLGVNLSSISKISWSPNAPISGADDTGITRNAPGVVEFNNGTPGIFADGKLRTLIATSTVRLAVFTVAGLPASPTQGDTAAVNNATACTFLATPVGGGSTFCPVVYNGSAWIAH